MSTPTSAATRTRYAALIAASAMLATLGLGVAPSQAEESGSPSASPEASATSEDTTTSVEANNPDWVPPESVDTYVGQSVQVRKNADGFQNSDLANFRWTVTQVNAESLNGLDTSIPLPMDDAPGLRSLTGSGNMPTVVDGGVLFDFDDVNGIQTKRTLNLWPQDRPLAVDVTAEFTLDGEKVQAQDIVGAGGLVTATYTIINQTVETQDVTFENVKGEDDTEEVETSQAFVGISKQFIPQSWAQFDPGNGIFGADGRGNYQTQWISLAFLPFAEEGKASFGWSAVIPPGEGFIPKMVIEVSPLYVPTHVAEDEAGEGAAADNGVPKPNVDPAMSTVQSGVEDLVAGVESLADTLGKTKGEIKEGVSIAVSQIKSAIDELCAPDLLDCDAPEPEDPLELSELTTALDQVIASLNEFVETGVATTDPLLLLDYLDRIAADINDSIAEAKLGLDTAEQDLADLQATYEVECGKGVALNDPGDIAKCNAISLSMTATEVEIAKFNATIAASEKALEVVAEARAYVEANKGNLSTETAKDISAKLTKVNDALKAIQAQLDLLAPPLEDLSAGIDQIGAAIDAGLANLSDVGGSLDQISGGKAQISAGLGQAGDEVRNYIAEVVALAQATAEDVQETAADVEASANTVKAEMAGLKGRMAESPLPYSGGMNTVFAPAGNVQAVQDEATTLVSETGPVDSTDTIQPTTELFGAYQFMLDPADNNKPNTPWRILLALVFAVGAGFLGMWAAKRAKA